MSSISLSIIFFCKQLPADLSYKIEWKLKIAYIDIASNAKRINKNKEPVFNVESDSVRFR